MSAIRWERSTYEPMNMYCITCKWLIWVGSDGRVYGHPSFCKRDGEKLKLEKSNERKVK